MTRRALAAALALSASVSAAQACDVDAGRKLFARCGTCHSTEPGRHIIGPSLSGILRRPVAALPDYRYSAALRAFGAGGQVWDRARLSASYLAAPREVVPGTRMAFAGLGRGGQREDVVCYLETLR